MVPYSWITRSRTTTPYIYIAGNPTPSESKVCRRIGCCTTKGTTKHRKYIPFVPTILENNIEDEVRHESPSFDDGPSCDQGVCTNWKDIYDYPKVHDPTDRFQLNPYTKPDTSTSEFRQDPALTNSCVSHRGIIPSPGASPPGQYPTASDLYDAKTTPEWTGKSTSL